MKKLFLSTLILLLFQNSWAQTLPCDCAYPVIFIHGWTGNSDGWSGVVDNSYFKNIWGTRADIFHAAPNASTSNRISGNDGIMWNSDDDIQWIFSNENNVLAPGCIYAINFDVAVDNGVLSPFPLAGGSPGYFNSDNNESAITKQGALVGKAIAAVLAANPTKKKVILVGHSMGGLAAREYLQRTVNNNATSAKRWWVNPSQADGHKVAKLLTLGTPHLGSNTMGNLSNLRQANSTTQDPTHSSARINQNAVQPNQTNPTIDDMLPDLASESVRDLRYSYDNWNLFAQDYPGVYLFGGKESDIPTLPYSYWTNDVNCNGIVDNTTQIGINQSGKSVGKAYEWDGTRDNPSMPLPTNLRYTYYVSNTLSGGTLTGGDLVVDDQRQWLYINGNGSGTTSSAGIPVPSDGTNYRLADRILLQGGPNHLGETSDVDNIVRGLDEGDYPNFAFDINMGSWYAGMAQIRATEVVETPNNNDPDWFKFTLSASTNVTVQFYPTAGLAGRLDLYTTAPNQYAAMTVNGNKNVTFTTTTSGMLSLSSGTALAAGTYYVRVRHNGVGATHWRTPYKIRVVNSANARESMSFGQPEVPSSNVILFSAYPNPTENNATINLQLAESKKVKLSLNNLVGQSVLNLYEGTVEGEEFLSIPFNMSQLPKGIYLLTLEGEGVFKTEKIVKQ